MRRSFRTWPVAAVVVVVGLAGLSRTGRTADMGPVGPADDRVDRYVTQQMAKHHIPGLSVAVVQQGRVVHLQGYGQASAELGVQATADTVYHLASATKVVAGVVAMLLVQDGKLSLDTPVTELLPGLPEGWKSIRVRHLLSHTSGIPDVSKHPAWAGMTPEKQQTASPRDIARLLTERPLTFPAGDDWSYGQAAFALFGLIVEMVSETPHPEFVDGRILRPLGMRSTAFGDSLVPVDGRPSTLYNRESGGLRNWVYQYPPWVYPAAGLNSSATDLIALLIALDSGKLLRPEGLDALWAPVRLNSGQTRQYGLGWSVGDYRGRRVVGHEGGGHAWVAHFPDDHLSVVVLCNLNGCRADEIQYGIADLYLAQ
jgi:CubicO group peptidase (beta-lactamase class C family)